MNAAIRAVVRTALSKNIKVKGILRGFAGLLEEEFVELDSKVFLILFREVVLYYILPAVLNLLNQKFKIKGQKSSRNMELMAWL